MPTKSQLAVALHHAEKEIIGYKVVNKKLRTDIDYIREVNKQMDARHDKDKDKLSWKQLKSAEKAREQSAELQQAIQQSDIEIATQRDEALKKLRELRERFTGITKARSAQAELIRNNAFTIDAMLTDLKQARQTNNTLANALQRMLDMT